MKFSEEGKVNHPNLRFEFGEVYIGMRKLIQIGGIAVWHKTSFIYDPLWHKTSFIYDPLLWAGSVFMLI
jgi:hypothetical protein